MLIRALSVKKIADDLYDVQVPLRELTSEEREVLVNLFPNLVEQAFYLLQKEAMLAAILTQDEADAVLEHMEANKKDEKLRLLQEAKDRFEKRKKTSKTDSPAATKSDLDNDLPDDSLPI